MASVLLLSGGLDSVVASWAARADYPPTLGITFDYGQRAAPREIASALEVCADLNITHRLIKLPWLAKLTPPSVSDPDSDLAAATDRSVWVPARNAVFISIAASFAEALDCDAIICGFNAEEAATFWDNSPEFVRRFNAMLELATQNSPKVISPTLNLTKAEIVRLGLQVGAPLHLVWSCYGSGPEHCWQCPSCRRLRHALRTADYWEEWLELRHESRG